MGEKNIPASAALTFASVPVKVIVASADPSPAVKERPVSCESVSVPLVALSVIWSEPKAASTSLMLMRFPFPLENVRFVSSLTLCAAGTLFTGASLTALTVMLTVSVSV